MSVASAKPNPNPTSQPSLVLRAPEVAQNVTRVPTLFVNAYLVSGQDGWVLVDTGLPNSAPYLLRAAAERFGADTPPQSIVLTHGHFDHAGSGLALAKTWDVPIYAHPLELPYLTGLSDYPPKDPTTGGAIALMARAFPDEGYDFGTHVHALPEDGSVPGLPEWRWQHTPGHTPGHVSLWRERDRTLLAGDAFATMDLESWTAHLTHARDLNRPPAPFTPDWPAAHRSIKALAQLEPRTVAAGHGREIAGDDLAARLHRFAAAFSPPTHGRYVGEPARADDLGVASLPPPVQDPLPGRVAGVGLGLLAGAVLFRLFRRREGLSTENTR